MEEFFDYVVCEEAIERGCNNGMGGVTEARYKYIQLLYQLNEVLLVQRSCGDKNDIFFVVNALRISSHIGANRFVG